MKRILDKINKNLLNIAYYACILIIALLFIRVFVFARFRVSTNSMQPTIKIGNQLLVNKLVYGPRIFNVFDVLEGKRTKVYRIYGFGEVERNDIVVFHFPYPESNKEIKMTLNKFYVKRCIGLPGDTIFIRNGFYKVKGYNKTLGYIPAQSFLSQEKSKSLKNVVVHTIQPNSISSWTIKNMGNIYIPKKGDKIQINPTNVLIYKKIIEWELQEELTEKDNKLFLKNEQLLKAYTFLHNYYFMAGDNVMNSQDSRYWGLLPDELIVGKAWVIW